jgi:geranylgeranyl reductase family protein
MYDVTVIGGGPAGASCAESLAQKGFSCLLLEKYDKRRYKTCAGGLSFEAFSLHPVPSSIVERKIVAVRIFSPSHSLDIEMKETPGYTVYRTEYDQRLRDNAHDKGAEVHYEEPVRTVMLETPSVAGKKEYRSRVVVGAFGVCPSLYRQFNIHIPQWVQLLQHEYRLPETIISERIGNCIDIYFDTAYAAWAYSWIFPKKDGVSVGLFSLPRTPQKRERLAHFIRDHQSKLKGAVPRKFGKKYTFGGLIPFRPVEKTYGEKFVLVGDSAGFCDPITYEGISNALKSGKIAASAIEDYLDHGQPLSSYEYRWKKELFREDLKYAQKLQKLMYGHSLSDRLVEAIIEIACHDHAVRNGFKWFFTRENPRKVMYDIIMKRKHILVKKLGLSSIRLLPRLLSWM